MLALKKQSTQIIQQAQKEKESFLKEKNNLQMMLQRVREAQTKRRVELSCLLRWLKFHFAFLQEKENLSNLEKKYGELTGGRSFPINPLSMKEVRCDVICQSK